MGKDSWMWIIGLGVAAVAAWFFVIKPMGHQNLKNIVNQTADDPASREAVVKHMMITGKTRDQALADINSAKNIVNSSNFSRSGGCGCSGI